MNNELKELYYFSTHSIGFHLEINHNIPPNTIKMLFSDWFSEQKDITTHGFCDYIKSKYPNSVAIPYEK